jgi:hypothetical protein
VPNATEGLQASSYADLLAPTPNAVELLQADNAARAQNIELAHSNYYYPYRYYHHHHHHAYARHHHPSPKQCLYRHTRHWQVVVR